MKIGLVVDSSSDLPHSFFENGDVELMPSVITVGDQSFDDLKDDRQTIQYHADTFERMRQKSDILATSRPYTSEKIEALFLEKLVCKYDHVFCIMASPGRSDIYDHAFKASRGILTKYKAVRHNAGLDGHFALAVINSETFFGGPAVLAVEAVRMIKENLPPSVINLRICELVPHTYCYLVPPDLEHVYKRASQRGDKSIGWLGYKLGGVLDIKPIILGHQNETRPVAKMRGFEPAAETIFANATRAVEEGLMTPAICVAFGGDPINLPQLPGFNRLKQAAAIANIQMHITPMSISGSVHAGPGCVSVAFISDKHVFEERV